MTDALTKKQKAELVSICARVRFPIYKLETMSEEDLVHFYEHVKKTIRWRKHNKKTVFNKRHKVGNRRKGSWRHK